MTITLEKLVDLTEKIVAKARGSEEVVELVGGEGILLQEREVVYLSALARALRKSGIDVRSMTREVGFLDKFDPKHNYTTPLYYLHYQGEDFASHGMCGEAQVLESMNFLVDADHFGAQCSGYGQPRDISRAEDADSQEGLHDWFDRNVGAFLAHDQAQEIDRTTSPKSPAKTSGRRI